MALDNEEAVDTWIPESPHQRPSINSWLLRLAELPGNASSNSGAAAQLQERRMLLDHLGSTRAESRPRSRMRYRHLAEGVGRNRHE